MKRLFFVLSLFICGCSSQLLYTVRSNYDDFNKIKHTYMINNGVDFSVDLNLHRLKPDTGNAKYYFEVRYSGSHWFFIESGKSLIFLIDGKKYELEGNGSANNREVFSANTIIEKAIYDCDLDLLNTIINANSVKMRIIGQSSYSDHELTQTNIMNFKDFMKNNK
jgi:hypothetical protein